MADGTMLDGEAARLAAEAADLRRLEALLFASPEPLSYDEIEERLPGADVPALVAALTHAYAARGVNVREAGGRVQLVTAPDCAEVLVSYRVQNKRLSRAALETLAIVAYHQPVSRAEIEEVRGVAVAKGSLDQLLALGWLCMAGRRDAPGRPILYATSSAFLDHFGLASLGDLPNKGELEAQGLLDARLPEGFSVPRPEEVENDPREHEFVMEFDQEG